MSSSGHVADIVDAPQMTHHDRLLRDGVAMQHCAACTCPIYLYNRVGAGIGLRAHRRFTAEVRHKTDQMAQTPTTN
jgi:hypothetical protein